MEKDKEEILRQAKQIIDNFHSALKDVEKLEEARVERDECERAEKEGEEPDGEFRKIMFSNAPKTRGECIEAERGKWVQ